MIEPTILAAHSTLPPPPGDGPSMAWREEDGQIYAFRYDKGRCVPFVLHPEMGMWLRLTVH